MKRIILASFLVLVIVGFAQAAIIYVPGDYPTIQAAIDSASDGDVISVATGTYVENINFNGKNIVVQSEDGPLSTILTPANLGVPIVWFHDGETLVAKLIGFTLKNGGVGGLRGSAINFDHSSPTIENCIITYNTGYAVIWFRSTYTVFANCLIYDNPATDVFHIDPGSGGSPPEIINSTIVDNSGGSLFQWATAVKVKNCIILDGGIAGNVDISYSLVEGGFVGEGNIDADPLFVDASNGDYHLQANSPAIDTGTAFGVPYSDIDGMLRPRGAGHDMGAYEAYLPVVLIPYTPDPTNDNTPTLDWWDVVGASTYTLQYSGQSDFSTYTEVTNITESTYQITDVLSDGVWYWRVRALDSEGVAGWWTALDYFVVDTNVTLTISAATGGSTNPLPGSYTYDSGTEVIITATLETGYRFSGWTGDVPSGHENDNPLTFTMDSNKSITANFIRQYTLTIASGSGGTTSPSPADYTHDADTQVTITAIPDSGYEFTGWSGDASGTTTPITITMDENKSVTANFTATSTGGDDGDDTEGGDKKCFIATVAYGSPLHPHVEILRDFRDRYLMPSKLGRTLVYLYYKYSPFVADFIAKHKVLKTAVRINLLPMVAFSYSMIHLGSIITSVIMLFIFMLPLFLIAFWRKRIIKRLKNCDS